MPDDPVLRQAVQAAASADDAAQRTGPPGCVVSEEELLRLSGEMLGRVTLTKQDNPMTSPGHSGGRQRSRSGPTSQAWNAIVHSAVGMATRGSMNPAAICSSSSKD